MLEINYAFEERNMIGKINLVFQESGGCGIVATADRISLNVDLVSNVVSCGSAG